MVHYVIRDKTDGALIGLDSGSGGYPWKPPHISEVKLWPSFGAAAEYAKMFKKEPWEICEIEYRINRAWPTRMEDESAQ